MKPITDLMEQDFDRRLTQPVSFAIVAEFERQVASFFGAPYAVAVDSCTHGLELCLRYTKQGGIVCPKKTYLSVPMLADKLSINLDWYQSEIGEWLQYYHLAVGVIDAATMWCKDSYLPGTFMCISFQYQKHLSLGRGGMILCPDEQSYKDLLKMAYDGRERGIPWREQDIDTVGYHYYMTPETAALGLQKLPGAIERKPRIWSWKDYPDVSQFKVFKK